MANPRSAAEKDPASNYEALAALVRLLARQVATDWLNGADHTEDPLTAAPTETNK